MRAPESVIAEADAILDNLNKLIDDMDSVTCGELKESGDEALVSYVVYRRHLGSAKEALEKAKVYLDDDLTKLDFPLNEERRQQYISSFVFSAYNI